MSGGRKTTSLARAAAAVLRSGFGADEMLVTAGCADNRAAYAGLDRVIHFHFSTLASNVNVSILCMSSL